ncbi:2-hydroxychromene-2-carboxylate isomerase [Sphingopyxis yananensis]|uniref:2-hydroxychromene-2-carboxylate isomerase n=1 Tax=Sphingopyxis yananensis TaxID=2886687 RepID=UPI001D107204|nr:2-hydroxychromene-2-carboxylate isomerase [Sphingopyxis yananensis]MCC2601680.1 2-hydroxychromene-2-carboxylate isomerase [Sphingopyxis yananensis]
MADRAADRVEFFFDLSSPWTCLAFHNVKAVRQRTGAAIRWRPILVGGVFNAVNPAVYAAREQSDNRKLQHSWKILDDWAALAGVAMHFPSKYHPAKSVAAMRFCCALEDDQAALEAFAGAAFDAYFGRQENLDDPDVMAREANSVGLDGAAIKAASGQDDMKARLRANTEEVIARGGYGSPTIFVDGNDMYFGNDQMPLVEAALMREKGTA